VMALGKEGDGIYMAAFERLLELFRVEVGANMGNVFGSVEVEMDLAKAKKVGTHGEQALKRGREEDGARERIFCEVSPARPLPLSPSLQPKASGLTGLARSPTSQATLKTPTSSVLMGSFFFLLAGGIISQARKFFRLARKIFPLARRKKK